MKNRHSERQRPSLLWRIIALTLVSGVLASVATSQTPAEGTIASQYSAESGRTVVQLTQMKLAGNKNDFRVGAAYEFDGKTLVALPCCMVITMSAVSRKQFLFQTDHRLTIWADGEKFEVDDVIWRESDEATAFVLAGVAFPESLFAGITSDEFKQIAYATQVKAKLGKFEFKFSPEHLAGFRRLWESMKPEATASSRPPLLESRRIGR